MRYSPWGGKELDIRLSIQHIQRICLLTQTGKSEGFTSRAWEYGSTGFSRLDARAGPASLSFSRAELLEVGLNVIFLPTHAHPDHQKERFKRICVSL